MTVALVIIIAETFCSSVTTAASHSRSRASASCLISLGARLVRPLRYLGYGDAPRHHRLFRCRSVSLVLPSLSAISSVCYGRRTLRWKCLTMAAAMDLDLISVQLRSAAERMREFSRGTCGWGLLLRRNRPVDLKVGLCTGGGFAQYLPPFDSDSVRD